MADPTACYMARWHNDAGCFTALVLRRRVWLYLITVGYPVGVARRPLTEERYLKPLPNLPVATSARTLLKLGRHNGISRYARAILRRVAAS